MKRKVLVAAFATTVILSSNVNASGSSGQVKPPQQKSQPVTMWIWEQISSIFE